MDQMNKERSKKNIKFLFIIFLFCIIVFIGYYFITGEKNPFSQIIESITNNDNELNDNYNGVYTYNDELNGSKFVFSGCSFSKISNYILIDDEYYYVFRSSCMGTYLKDNGKTESLDIKVNENESSYYINYNDKRFDKDPSVNNISLNNRIASSLRTVELSTYQLAMQETQFEGNYYDLEKVKIAGISSNLTMSFFRDEISGFFTIGIYSGKGRETSPLYSFTTSDLNFLPDMYAYGENVAVVERRMKIDTLLKYDYRFNVVNPKGVVYRLEDMFPIVIDGVTLDLTNSIYIMFDSSTRYFRMLVGNDDKFCVNTPTEENKNDIAYYEFKIEYTNSNGFSKPKFVKIGYKSEGCKYVDNILGGKK